MAYKVHVVTPAKREIKKLERAVQAAILKANLSLAQNPRPEGCVSVIGRTGLYRIHVPSAPKCRIIYHIHDQFQTVIVVTVRLKGKDTYRDIPIQSLTAKLKELAEECSKK